MAKYIVMFNFVRSTVVFLVGSKIMGIPSASMVSTEMFVTDTLIVVPPRGAGAPHGGMAVIKGVVWYGCD